MVTCAPARMGALLCLALAHLACGGSTDVVLANGGTSGGGGTGQGGTAGAPSVSYAVVDTDQTSCYDESRAISCPSSCGSFFGQDAQYQGWQPSYTENGDGTVTDNVTGLMWQQDPGPRQSYDDAVAGVSSCTLGGHADWRLPTIKELYSLILFSSRDPSGYQGTDTSGLMPFIDTDAFVFEYGDTSAGQRIIDSQWVTSTIYGSTVMDGQECFFGVNFADGRIKCYPTQGPPGSGGYFAIYVRGASNYGDNSFANNGDGTVSDSATGLEWQQSDSGTGVLWADALDHCEGLSLGGMTTGGFPMRKSCRASSTTIARLIPRRQQPSTRFSRRARSPTRPAPRTIPATGPAPRTRIGPPATTAPMPPTWPLAALSDT